MWRCVACRNSEWRNKLKELISSLCFSSLVISVKTWSLQSASTWGKSLKETSPSRFSFILSIVNSHFTSIFFLNILWKNYSFFPPKWSSGYPVTLLFFLQIWDIGGQPRFRSMWERYCRGVNAIVWVPKPFLWFYLN